jgi:hypothetical protein
MDAPDPTGPVPLRFVLGGPRRARRHVVPQVVVWTGQGRIGHPVRETRPGAQ